MKNLHVLLIIYLIASVIFSTKRSMLLDTTIAISLLAVLYRNDVLHLKMIDAIKVFIFLFVISASLDLAWLIVYFPSWNRSATSEDEGA